VVLSRRLGEPRESYPSLLMKFADDEGRLVAALKASSVNYALIKRRP
jgi:hypothetical protein